MSLLPWHEQQGPLTSASLSTVQHCHSFSLPGCADREHYAAYVTACLVLRGCLPWCCRRDRCLKLEASVTEMQECLHEEECKRREVRLFQLQGVSERLAGCPLLSQVPLPPEQCQ